MPSNCWGEEYASQEDRPKFQGNLISMETPSMGSQVFFHVPNNFLLLHSPSFPGDLISPAFLDSGVCQTQQNQPLLSSFRHSPLLSLSRDHERVERVLGDLPLCPLLQPALPGSQVVQNSHLKMVQDQLLEKH